MIGTDGPIHIDADAVTVTYVVPSGLAGTFTGATLHYRVGASETTLTMRQVPAKTWKATIPGMAHNTLVQWWLEITHQPPSGPTVTLCEPATGEPYSFRFFSHWNPFPGGLPELWSKCKKGTDAYTFEGDETIQFEQVMQARWVLDRLGEQFYHSPHVRSQMPNCCREQHIVFRWSGSNHWPHYLDGGKSCTTPGSWPIEPLHNLSPDNPIGSLWARQSWRGVDPLWPENATESLLAPKARPAALPSSKAVSACTFSFRVLAATASRVGTLSLASAMNRNRIPFASNAARSASTRMDCFSQESQRKA